jgi:hypothetical protein
MKDEPNGGWNMHASWIPHLGDVIKVDTDFSTPVWIVSTFTAAHSTMAAMKR